MLSLTASRAERSLRLVNAAASVAVVMAAVGLYTAAPHTQSTLDRVYGRPGFSVNGFEFLWTAAVVYAGLVFLYMLRFGEARPSKSLVFARACRRCIASPMAAWRAGLGAQERVAVLSTLLKAFFAPMMTMSLMAFFMSAFGNAAQLLEGDWASMSFASAFNRYGFWVLFQLILFVDVLIFTVGYLVETRRLGNEIRSVDPTLLGWAAALMCYPPFNALTAGLIGAQTSDFPQFENAAVHLGMNLVMLALFAVYAAASVALGWKASNLTHRGIVARGPYALVRHPAYICKCLAWWIGALPLMALAFERSAIEGLQSVASMAAWTGIYALRAWTEERHLRRVDGEYDAYCTRVPYRFIPRLL
jgi:protein-S-isoprenylcysteine O-methyltransferase Ste14